MTRRGLALTSIVVFVIWYWNKATFSQVVVTANRNGNVVKQRWRQPFLVYVPHTAYPDQQTSEGGSQPCEKERPSINERCVIFICLFFGGLFCTFCASDAINKEWRVLRAALVYGGIGCCDLGLLFWFLSCLIYPYSWGLPPQWLPVKWRNCPEIATASRYQFGGERAMSSGRLGHYHINR